MTTPFEERPRPPGELEALAIWQTLRHLAGPHRLSRPVAGLDFALGADYLPSRPNVIVVSTVPFDHHDVSLDVWVRRLTESGAVALLLPRAEPLLFATQDLAERLGLPVFGCAEVLSVGVGVRSWLAEPATELAESLATAARTLGEEVTSLEELVARLSAVLALDVAVLTGDGRPLAGVPVDTGALVTSDARVQQTYAEETGTVFVPLTNASHRRPDAWLAARLPARMAARAKIAVHVLQLASLTLRALRAEDRLNLERDARARSALLADIQRHPTQLSAMTQARAGDLGWRLDDWSVGFFVGVLDDDVDWYSSTVDLTHCMEEAGLHVEVVLEPDGWIGWLSQAREPDDARVAEIVAGFRAVQRSISARLTTYMGVGSAHRGPTGLLAALGEARDAARLSMARRESGRFSYFGRLGVAQLLLAWTRTDVFESAAYALLEPLQGHAGELLKTLSVYLDNESNLTETAAVLGAHRNTIATRIGRIEQVLEASLSNADERLALHLACRTVLGQSPDDLY